MIADTAFPRGTDQIKGRIRAPIKAGQKLHGTRAEIDQRLKYDRELLSFRQTAEWGMRALQGSFGRLRVPLEVAHREDRADLLEICIRLHNLRARLVGVNEIRTVYFRHWGEDEVTWRAFENMLFADQRRNDRVSRFHIHAVYDSDDD